MERVGQEAIAHLAEAAQQGRALPFAQAPDASERRRRRHGSLAQQAPQVAPKAVDVQVEDVLGHLAAAARARGAQPAQERPLLGARRAERLEPVLEEAHHDVHVPTRADAARQLPEHADATS